METILKKLGKVAITVDKYLWSKEKEYDKLTIVRVNDNGVSYLSRKQVPANTDITDSEYWFPFTKDVVKGDSAYQVAVNNGFEGTEEEWLESLRVSQEDLTRLNSAIQTINDEKSDKADTYTKEEVNNLIVPHDSSLVVVQTLPDTGEPNTIYRLYTQGGSSYSDHMYVTGTGPNTGWIQLAEYDNAIDNEPVENSENLVKSGGIYPIKNDVNETKIDVYGGTKIVKTERVSSGTLNIYLDNNTIFIGSHNSMSGGNIANDGYKKVRVCVKYARSASAGGVANVLLCFHVTDDFVFDDTKGYVQTDNGYIYYPQHAVSSKQKSGNFYWLTVDGSDEIEVPDGVDRILFTTNEYPGTNSKIELYKEINQDGLIADVTTLTSDVATFNEELTNISDKVESTYDDTVYNIVSSINPAGGLVDASGTLRTSSSYHRYSFTNIGYTRVRAYIGLNDAFTDGMVPIAFFDENDNFIAEQSTPAIYAITGMTWYEVSVPSNAKTIRISHRTTAGTEQALAFGVLNMARTNAAKITALTSDVADTNTAINRNASIVGWGSLYNKRAGMVAEQRSFSSEAFAPFIKQPEPTSGKRVQAKCVIPYLCGVIQGGAIHGKLFIASNHVGNTLFVNMAIGKRIQYTEGMLPSDSHHNSAFFSNHYYDDNDAHPLIYFSGGNAEDTSEAQLIRGYRVTSNNGVYALTLVHTIQLPPLSETNSTSGNAYLYDGKLYVVARTSDQTKGIINYYAMPEMTEGTSVLTINDRLGSFTFSPGTSVVATLQGGFVKDGILYNCNGNGIFAVNLETQQYLAHVNLRNKVIPYELETCFMYNGDLFVLAINRDTNIVNSPTAEIYYVELLDE